MTRIPLRPVHCWARSRVRPISPAFDAAVRRLRYPGTGQAQHARDVDDAASRLHHPGTCLSHPVAPVEVDIDDGSKLPGSFPGRWYGGADAGVADQYVDPAKGAHGGVDELTTVVWTRHVGPHRSMASSACVLDKCGWPPCGPLDARRVDTSAPPSARATAKATPNPLDAPVTIATRSSMRTRSRIVIAWWRLAA